MISKELRGIKIHPAANLFPMMSDAEIQSLADDIRENGVDEYIEFWQGQLIDGRNRWVACNLAGVDPEQWTAEIENDELDPVAHVMTKNLHRRHLSTPQRAMVAAKLKEHYAGLAKDRQKAAGGDKVSDKANAGALVEKLPQALSNGKARDHAGKALNVSGRTVDHAVALNTHGSAELIEAVDRGEVSLSKAAKIARVSPKEIQLEEAKPKPKETPAEAETDTNAEATDKQHEAAVSAAADACNLLQRSKLIRLSKNNPSRDYAFDEVIRWLKNRKAD